MNSNIIIKAKQLNLTDCEEFYMALGYSNSYNDFTEWQGGYICSDRESLNLSYNFIYEMFGNDEITMDKWDEVHQSFTELYKNIEDGFIRVLIE